MSEQPKKLMPKLRFPEFRDNPGWDAVNGNKLFNLIDRRPAPPGLPILAITQEQGAVPRNQIAYHVSVTEASIASYKEVQPEDFIISLRSFQGGIEYSRFHGICSPAYLILKRAGDGSDEYFRHLFKSDRFIQQMTRNIEGLRDGKMVSYKQFSEQLLPTPDPAEQRKIAACLASLDELLAAAGRKLEALRAHKKGLMQQLFPRPGESCPRLRFPEFRDAGKWKERKAGTLFANRKTKGEDGLPIYSVTINDGMVRRDSFDREFYDIEDAAGNKKAYRNDIAYNMMRMWQGACGVAPEDCLVSPAYVVLSPLEGVHSAFFEYLFKLSTSLHLLESHSRGLTKDRLRLYFDNFEKMPLLVPGEAEQQRIAACLSSLDALIAAASRKLAALRAHKKALMQQLFPSPEGL